MQATLQCKKSAFVFVEFFFSIFLMSEHVTSQMAYIVLAMSCSVPQGAIAHRFCYVLAFCRHPLFSTVLTLSQSLNVLK